MQSVSFSVCSDFSGYCGHTGFGWWAQSRRLKWLLFQQRQQQEATLLRKIESRVQYLIQQKDQEIAQASQKTVELQTLVTKLETERREWQSPAEERQAMVVSLNNTLEQRMEDAASRCEAINKRPIVVCLITSACKTAKKGSIGVLMSAWNGHDVVVSRVCFRSATESFWLMIESQASLGNAKVRQKLCSGKLKPGQCRCTRNRFPCG